MRRNIAPASVVNPLFYAVIEGDAPGVYGSQWASLFWNSAVLTNLLWLRVAIHARGLRATCVTVYTTRESANQAFVDAYMAGRVSALPAPGR